jgi:hypothetical protein
MLAQTARSRSHDHIRIEEMCWSSQCNQTQLELGSGLIPAGNRQHHVAYRFGMNRGNYSPCGDSALGPRCELECLDERDLADVGLTRLDAFNEMQKPLWQT